MAASGSATGPDPRPDAAARPPSSDPTSVQRAARTKLEERPCAARSRGGCTISPTSSTLDQTAHASTDTDDTYDGVTLSGHALARRRCR
jgi:hypothetical protein